MFYIIIIQYSSAWPLALNCVHTVHLCPRHPDVTVATQTKHLSPLVPCSNDPGNLTLKATELIPQSLFLQDLLIKLFTFQNLHQDQDQD